MKRTRSLPAYLLAAAVAFSCHKTAPKEAAAPAQVTEATDLAIEKAILEDQQNFYYTNFKEYPQNDPSLPIGVFDSGTGGLTILDALVNYDQFNNQSKAAGADKEPDFSREKFIYLADQANMPYGNYYSANKSDLLVEHIIKDAQFLMASKYYTRSGEKAFQKDKQPVKAIVVACNTATAYGKEHIERFIKKTGIDLKVIGVIDAGAKGALEAFKNDENGTVGVFATVGTIASKGYEKTFLALKDKMGYTGTIQVVNQGGQGLAEAIDEEPDFIQRDAKAPRQNYRGPSLANADYQIDKTLLDVYNFNFDHQKMLCDSKNSDDCQVLQLNAPENYVRYHLVSMMEKLRKTPNAQPLKAVILGCTHYPYMTKDINQVLGELYNYKKNGQYVYRALMAQNVRLIDPAINVAAELHAYLKEKNLFNQQAKQLSSEFYISVPNLNNPSIKTDSVGRFTYDYKYGRNVGEIQEYVAVVPFSKKNIPVETLNRFKTSIPQTYKLIQNFHQANPKTATLTAEEKIN